MKFFQQKGRRGGVDARGLASMRYLYQVWDCSDSEALLFEPKPAPVNLPVTSVEFDENQVSNDYLNLWVTYEGIPGDSGVPPESKTQYFRTMEWREEPIETFPDQQSLIDQYGATEQDGRLQFPQFVAVSSVTGGIIGGATTGAAYSQTPNPLFGVTTYPIRLAVWHRSYVRRDLPPGLDDTVGDVLKKFPWPLKNAGNGPWMVDNPEYRKRGNAWEICEKIKQLPNELHHIEALQLLLQKKK